MAQWLALSFGLSKPVSSSDLSHNVVYLGKELCSSSENHCQGRTLHSENRFSLQSEESIMLGIAQVQHVRAQSLFLAFGALVRPSVNF